MDNLIITYLINKNNEAYCTKANIPIIQNFVLHNVFSKYIYHTNNPINDKNLKYQLYKNLLQNQILLLGDNKDRAFEIFTQYQKILFSINKFKYIFKLKFLYSKYDYNYDMEMNELTSYSPNKIINLIQHKTIYSFALNDLIKIIHTSITHMGNMIHYPYKPRNPFTNIEFNYCDLCNIYIGLFNSGIKLRTHILDYFNLGFNINKFSKKYRIYILENYIKNEFFELNDISTYTEIFNMFQYARVELNITRDNIEIYDNINTHYIEFMKEQFKTPLFYYTMLTVVEPGENLAYYTRNFIKHFKRVMIEKPNIHSFDLFEQERIDAMNTSLFSNSYNNSESLFGLLFEHQYHNDALYNGNDNQSPNFGPNPF